METQTLQTDSVVLKEKATIEKDGYVDTYTYRLKSASGQVVLYIASADDAIDVGQEFEIHLVPVERS